MTIQMHVQSSHQNRPTITEPRRLPTEASQVLVTLSHFVTNRKALPIRIECTKSPRLGWSRSWKYERQPPGISAVASVLFGAPELFDSFSSRGWRSLLEALSACLVTKMRQASSSKVREAVALTQPMTKSMLLCRLLSGVDKAVSRHVVVSRANWRTNTPEYACQHSALLDQSINLRKLQTSIDPKQRITAGCGAS